MALFDNDQRKMLVGAAMGVAAVSVVRATYPLFRGLGRPFAKATIKSGITLYEKGKETMAHFAEAFEDLLAEARAELEAESLPPAAAPETGPEPVQ